MQILVPWLQKNSPIYSLFSICDWLIVLHSVASGTNRMTEALVEKKNYKKKATASQVYPMEIIFDIFFLF